MEMTNGEYRSVEEEKIPELENKENNGQSQKGEGASSSTLRRTYDREFENLWEAVSLSAQQIKSSMQNISKQVQGEAKESLRNLQDYSRDKVKSIDQDIHSRPWTYMIGLVAVSAFVGFKMASGRRR